ncbi:MAG TPA: cyclodeaminase/cyclohydrolase family protein [Pedobacter sp.]|nr:cyclodeaminase/cyclohydrolase family protein [Pedobacter sp.]
MEINLLTITTEELLEKFGAGSHKPGSGSAAAFQGMISAKLLVTVISLTNDKKHRDKYFGSISNLLKMRTQIETRIFPELVTLFQQDSVHFGKTINLRKARDKENNPIKRNQLNRRALGELKTSIQIPIRIANLCVELSEIGEFVFDNAFRSARGDSQVALSGAVAAIAGCVSIIQLNLLSFGSDEYDWSKEIIAECNSLKLKHETLNIQANSKIRTLEEEVLKKKSFYKDVNDLLKKARSSSYLSDVQIENIAIELQRTLWKNRDLLKTENTIDNPLEILRPSIIFRKAFGYQFDNSLELDIVYGENGPSETAGLIDQNNKFVQISNHLPPDVQNFTAAHELGHAIFHKQAVMHRDIPIDGLTSNRGSNKEEFQADKFASYFLMPAKQIKQLFEQRFMCKKFSINPNSTFNLTKGDISNLRRKSKNLRGLSRILASAEVYGDDFFKSIADEFNVSQEAMAIRLEELELLEY